MSDQRSALPGMAHTGFAHVAEMGLVGMVTLKADLSAPETVKAVKAAVGLELPEARRMTRKGDTQAVAWMAPDELLILCPHAEADAVVGSLSDTMGSAHHLALNVSDARAVFSVEGRDVREVLGKLTPADLAGLAEGEIRRSRLAQVPAAFWINDRTHGTVICFRSVAGYVADLLSTAAQDGAEPGYYA